MRAALGAGKWRLIRQLLTEASLLGLAGGGLGIVARALGLGGVAKIAAELRPWRRCQVDTRVLLFTLAVAVVTGWLFGLAPAIQLARPG